MTWVNYEHVKFEMFVDIHAEYQAGTCLGLKGDVWAEDINVSVYQKLSENKRMTMQERNRRRDHRHRT